MDRNLVKRRMIGLLVLGILVIPAVVVAQGIVTCDGVKDPCSYQDFVELLDKLVDFFITKIALPISALLFAYAGFLYLTAAGDEGQIKKAHGVFKNVFIGLILALSGWLVVNLIVSVLTNKGINDFLG